MSPFSIIPLYYSLKVALIQIPTSKCMADPRRAYSHPQKPSSKPRECATTRVLMYAVCARSIATHWCRLGWGLRTSYFLSYHRSAKEFLKLRLHTGSF